MTEVIYIRKTQQVGEQMQLGMVIKISSGLIICVLALSFGRDSHAPTKKENISLILLQDSESPIGIGQEEFWNSRSKFDTIHFVSKKYMQVIRQHFALLSKQKTTSDFSHAAAFLCENETGQIDTLYADLLFRYWKRDNIIYKDTTSFFKDHFSKLFLEEFE